jgi:hypothetical protein
MCASIKKDIVASKDDDSKSRDDDSNSKDDDSKSKDDGSNSPKMRKERKNVDIGSNNRDASNSRYDINKNTYKIVSIAAALTIETTTKLSAPGLQLHATAKTQPAERVPAKTGKKAKATPVALSKVFSTKTVLEI